MARQVLRTLGLAAVWVMVMTASVAQAALTLYYPFDGDATDSSGNGYNGTLNNFPASPWTTGVNAGALEFDGGNDYVSVGQTAPTLGFTGSFTASAWVNSDSLSGDHSVFGTDTGGTNKGLHLITRGNHAHLGFYSNDLGGVRTLETDHWYNIAWRYDTTINQQSIYINGVRDAVRTSSGDFVGTGSVNIGRALGGRYFDGTIDDVQIDNTALSVAQIQAMGAVSIPASERLVSSPADLLGTQSSGVRIRNVNGAAGNIDAAQTVLAGGSLGGNGSALNATVNVGGGGLFGSDDAWPNGGGDNFTTEATGLLVVPAAGVYVLGANSDDGARVQIGNSLINVDQFGGPSGASRVNFTLNFEAAGVYPYRVTMMEIGGGDYLEFYSGADANGAINAGSGTSLIGGGGLTTLATGQFFVRDVKSGGTVNNLGDAEALLNDTNPPTSESDGFYNVVNFWENGGHGRFGTGENAYPNGGGDHFATESTAMVSVTEAGTYTFGINGDDGGRVQIQGTRVVNDDAAHGPTDAFGQISFVAPGLYDLRHVFFEKTGGAESELFVAKGAKGAWDGDFRLVGDVAGGSLAVFSPMGWKADVDGNWSDATKWRNGAIPDGTDDFASFSLVDLSADRTVNLDSNRIVGALRFGDIDDTTGPYDWTIAAGGGTLTLDVTAGSPEITVLNDTATIAASIAGNEGVIKTGAGTLISTGANTYTGLTQVEEGTLQLQGVAFSTTARDYLIESGAILNIEGNTGVASGTSTISGEGTLLVTGGVFGNETPNSPKGSGRNIAMELGSDALIDIASGAKLINGGWANTTWTSNLADLNVDGTLDLWDGKQVFVDALTGSGVVTANPGSGGSQNITVGVDDGSGTFNGRLANGARAVTLTKTGSGTQTLAGTLDNNGMTATVNEGTLVLAKTSSGSVHATGGGGTSLTVNNGGTAQLAGTGGDQIYTQGDVVVNGGGTLDMNGRDEGFDGLNGGGTITNTNAAASTLTVGQNNADGNFSGTIQDGAGSIALVKTGTGALILTGNNSHSGGTTVNGGGRIQIDGDAALGAVPGSPTVNLTLDNGGVKNSNTTNVLHANRTVQLGAGGGWFTSGWGKNTTINGQITGPGGLTVNNDSGWVIPTNTGNDYAGNTVVGGTLNGSSGNNANLRVGASEVIPHGAGKGDLNFNASGGGAAQLDLNGQTETVNGLNSGGSGTSRITGTGTLRFGADNAGGSFGGHITTNVNLEKIGNGTQTLSGTLIDHFGTTTVSAGTLHFLELDDLHSSTLTIATGATAEFENSTQNFNRFSATSIEGDGTFVKSGTGLLRTGNAGGQFAHWNMSGGLIDIQAGEFRVSYQNNNPATGAWSGNLASMNIEPGALVNLEGGNYIAVDALTGGGTVSNRQNWAVGPLTVGTNNHANSPGNTATFSGVLQDGVGVLSLIKVGTGTQVLTGDNTYTGDTDVQQGTLQLQGGAFPTTARDYNISSGATLNLDGNTGIASGTSTIAGEGTLLVTGGVFGNETPNSPKGSGRNINMNLGGGALIDIDTGARMINGGWASFNWNSNLADMNVDGTLDLWDGQLTQVDALTGSGTVTHTTYGGLQGLVVGINNGSGSFSGTIEETAGHPVALTKNGTGTQILTGTNTYTGDTTVNAGTLQIGNGGTDGSLVSASDITVGDGTLGPGSGYDTLDFRRSDAVTVTNPVIVNSSGRIAQSGTGSLLLTNLTTPGSGGYNSSPHALIRLDDDADFDTGAPAMDRVIPGGTNPGGYGSSSAFGGMGSSGDVRLGTAAAGDTTLSMSWRGADSFEGFLLADVLSMDGLGYDRPYVLEMSYDEALVSGDEAEWAGKGGIFVAWLAQDRWGNEGWRNAVLGNLGEGANAMINYAGAWSDFQSAFGITEGSLASYLGSWGVDTAANLAWAILNHNSEFSVVGIPEPSSLGLLALGLLGLGLMRRK